MSTLAGTLLTALGIGLAGVVPLLIMFARANARAGEEAAITGRLARYAGPNREL
jgi:hypothetical protein